MELPKKKPPQFNECLVQYVVPPPPNTESPINSPSASLMPEAARAWLAHLFAAALLRAGASPSSKLHRAISAIISTLRSHRRSRFRPFFNGVGGSGIGSGNFSLVISGLVGSSVRHVG